MDIGWRPTTQTHMKGPRAQTCPTVLEAGLRVTLKLLLIYCSNAVTTQHGNLLTHQCPIANPSAPLLSVWFPFQHRSRGNSAEKGILTPDLCIRASVVGPTIRALQRCWCPSQNWRVCPSEEHRPPGYSKEGPRGEARPRVLGHAPLRPHRASLPQPGEWLSLFRPSQAQAFLHFLANQRRSRMNQYPSSTLYQWFSIKVSQILYLIKVYSSVYIFSARSQWKDGWPSFGDESRDPEVRGSEFQTCHLLAVETQAR